jgi:ribosomal protein S18 acetylase RimI-like enzyme
LLVLNYEPDALHISGLAAAPELRRLGIASSILRCTERMARMLNEEYLEL